MSEESFQSRLNKLLEDADLAPLVPELATQFEVYCSLIIRWNLKMNLSSIRDEGGILSRHFIESIACADALPRSIETHLDFGSGAGLPGIPIALRRPMIAVTLAESQGKKAAFLREAVRMLQIPVKVHGQRAETLAAKFDCVTLRAVDKMQDAVKAATRLVAPGGWMVLMTTQPDLLGLQGAVSSEFEWHPAIQLPGGHDRCIAMGQFLV